MKYKVHRIEVKNTDMQDKLERYINGLKGDVISILPNVKPTFMAMGATARIDFLLVVERLGS